MLYVENNEPGASVRLSQILNAIGYSAWWSIYPYFDARKFYANMENIWQNVVPSSNMICVPKEQNLNITGLEPFLGETDDCRACITRVSGQTAQT